MSDDIFDDLNLDDIDDSSDDFGGFGESNTSQSSDSFDDFGSSDDSSSSSQSTSHYSSSDFQDSPDDNQASQKKLGKRAFLFIGIGIVMLLIVFAISGAINKGSQKSRQQQQPVQQSGKSSSSNESASDILNSGRQNTNQSSTQTQQQAPSKAVTTVKDSGFNWSEITSTENITYSNNEYTELTFTVTDIKHYARMADESNSTLVTKSVIKGAIAGFPGTYTLEIPYSKGVKLDSKLKSDGILQFNVYVKIGDFNGKRVIDDVLTYNPN